MERERCVEPAVWSLRGGRLRFQQVVLKCSTGNLLYPPTDSSHGARRDCRIFGCLRLCQRVAGLVPRAVDERNLLLHGLRVQLPCWPELLHVRLRRFSGLARLLQLPVFGEQRDRVHRRVLPAERGCVQHDRCVRGGVSSEPGPAVALLSVARRHRGRGQRRTLYYTGLWFLVGIGVRARRAGCWRSS